MPYEIVRNDDEINQVLCDCEEAEENAASHFPGSIYEAGVLYAIEWLIGLDDTHPLDQ